MTSVRKSQRAWRSNWERIDAIAAFKAIDTNGNGLLDGEELARVAYVMDGGEIMSSKEVAAAEADIARNCAPTANGLMHQNWRGQGGPVRRRVRSVLRVDFAEACVLSLSPTHAAAHSTDSGSCAGGPGGKLA